MPCTIAARRVVGRGRNLVDRDRAGVDVAIDEVGERAADIDPDRFHDAPACILALGAFT